MPERSIPAIMAPPPARDNPFTRSIAGLIGLGFLVCMFLACVITLPWTTGDVQLPGAPDGVGSARYDLQYKTARHLPPTWWGGGVIDGETGDDTTRSRLDATTRYLALEQISREESAKGSPTSVDTLIERGIAPTESQIAEARPFYLMGTDLLGRDVFVRTLAGGGISLGIGIAAAMISVFLGTMYGAISGYVGGRVDSFMMRIVDILYGLPYILLVVLLAVAVDAYIDNAQVRASEQAIKRQSDWVASEFAAVPASERTDAKKTSLQVEAAAKFPSTEMTDAQRQRVNLITLLVAIGGVSWLTLARVIRGQVLSLKNQPFMEAARAMGVPVRGQFIRHLLPNLIGPITVYATLTVPQAILQESFLSFLGIGVKPPMPSWGNLAAEGLVELNPFKSNWWLLVFPCLLLGLTLLALNFVGEGLREALDPKRSRR